MFLLFQGAFSGSMFVFRGVWFKVFTSRAPLLGAKWFEIWRGYEAEVIFSNGCSSNFAVENGKLRQRLEAKPIKYTSWNHYLSLKIANSKGNFILEPLIFRGYLSFREGIMDYQSLFRCWKTHPGYPVEQLASFIRAANEASEQESSHFTPSIDEPIWFKGILAALYQHEASNNHWLIDTSISL